MKHTIELRFPRLFGRKKEGDGTDVRTEIDLYGKDKSVPTALLIAAPLVLGITVGYFVGFKSGVNKGGTKVIVVK